MINKNEIIFDVNHAITLAAGQVVQAILATESACKDASNRDSFDDASMVALAESSDRLNKAVQELAKQKYILQMLKGGEAARE